MAGRPRLDDSKWMPELIERLGNGESAARICEDPHMPGMRTVMDRLRENSAFSQDYAEAREKWADKVFDDLFDIADAGSEDVQRDRLRIDTRKWALARMNPKKYGDKMALDAKIKGKLTINVQDSFDGEGET